MAITLQDILDTDSLHDGELKHNSNNAAIETQVNQNETDIATNTSDINGLQSSKLDASTYTASDILTKLETVDGSGSGLDADLLDGQDSTYFLAASDYTASDVLTKLKTVDGSTSGLDADKLDGNESTYYTDIVSRLGYTPVDSADVGAASGVAPLDASSLVALSNLPTASPSSQSPNKIPLLDPYGALGIARTLGGSNRTALAITATDGKAFQAILRTDNSLAITNATDGFDTIRLGPTSGEIRDGNGRLLVDSGSNSNGEWYRFYDGTQICSAWVTLSYDSGFGGRLQGPWTYPATFSVNPAIVTTQRDQSLSSSVSRQYTVAAHVYDVTTTSAGNVGIYVANGTGFSSGDSGQVWALAIGKWY